MIVKKTLSQFNIFTGCKEYGIPLWQCPQFLFFIMGLIIILSSILVYAIGSQYVEEPQQVALLVLVLSLVLLVISFTITHSFEKLAEASRIKSEFINIVSHQLRAPLSNLKWALDFLMSGRLGKVEESQVEYFRILRENGTRMRELIGNLLTVSKIEMGVFPLKKTEFSLADLTKEVVEEFEPLSQASNVQIRFSAEENLPKVFADVSHIKVAVENLLENAIRYIKGWGVVEIKIEARPKTLYLEIKDTGVGIPQKDQKHIFQKFFRSQNILRQQTQGSGLGLYITKYIIEKSEGKIGFKSKEGEGSTFWFTLPTK